ALGVAWMAYGLGRVLSGRRLGLAAALGLLALPGFVIVAEQAKPDMILCFAITASALALAFGMRACHGMPRGWWFFVAGLAAGLGVVTKGPYGVVFPVIFALLWPIRRPGWRRPRLEWTLFIAALLVAVGAWAVPAYLRDGGHFLREMVFQE